MGLQVSETSPVRLFTIALSMVKIGSTVWKFIRNKETNKHLLFTDLIHKEIMSTIMAPKNMGGIISHKCSILGVGNEDFKMCK
jgi:hypothetical protein